MSTEELTEERIQELNELANDLGIAAQEVVPEMSTYGCYSAMRGPAGMSAGAFMWFESKEKLAEFVHIYPFWADGCPEPDDWQAFDEVIQKYFQGELDSDSACAQVNDILTDPYIDWMGTFEELTQGKGEFAQTVLADFQDMKDEEDVEETAIAAISDDQMDEFLDFIASYGV